MRDQAAGLNADVDVRGVIDAFRNRYYTSDLDDYPSGPRCLPVEMVRFDRQLRPVTSGSDAVWLEVRRDEEFWEIRTRYLLHADDRLAPQSLEVARRADTVLRRWQRQHPAFPCYRPCREASRSLSVPSFSAPQGVADYAAVLDEVLLDAVRQRIPPGDSTRHTCVAVALVHEPELESRYECRIRLRGPLLPREARRRDQRALCRVIGSIEQGWEERYGAKFFAYGTVQDYVGREVRDEAEKCIGVEVLRAYGRKSRVVRQLDVGALSLSLDVIAHGWDAYHMAPVDAEILAFGLERLAEAIAGAARTLSRLRAVVEELAAARNLVIEADIQELRDALDAGWIGGLPEHLRKRLEAGVGPASPGVTAGPAPVITTVYRLILRALPRDARTRFADENAPAGDKRLRLTRQRVRQVGEALGYLDHEAPPLRPEAEGPLQIDPRLEWLVARMLAQRYGESEDTLIRSLVHPALRGTVFPHLHFESDEAGARSLAWNETSTQR